ncbi:DapH/DapD/GlmU-related protein [Deinococcus hohokamensis]|uniref:DapH/DapD/GlmU-related protein n=1 Tax=Deinococcus hohokamensis TaxID=309883 RepID=A0ABV9IE45_9DEIO
MYVSLGENVWVGAFTFIGGNPSAHVQIGNNVDIAPKVTIITGTHQLGTPQQRAGLGETRGVIINDGVWIGAGSLILPGVSIGGGSVIAAGSVVNRDVPENVLVAGVPARVIKDLPES